MAKKYYPPTVNTENLRYSVTPSYWAFANTSKQNNYDLSEYQIKIMVRKILSSGDFINFISKGEELNVMSTNIDVVNNQLKIEEDGIIKVTGDADTDTITISSKDIVASGSGIEVVQDEDQVMISNTEYGKIKGKSVVGDFVTDGFLKYDGTNFVMETVTPGTPSGDATSIKGASVANLTNGFLKYNGTSFVFETPSASSSGDAVSIQGKSVTAPTGADANKFLKYNGTGFVLDTPSSGTSGGNATSIGGSDLPSSLPVGDNKYLLTYDVSGTGTPSASSSFKYYSISELADTIANAIKAKIPQYKKIEDQFVTVGTTPLITLTHKVIDGTEMVFLNGMLVDKDSDYTVDNTGLTTKINFNTGYSLDGYKYTITYMY